MLFQEKLDSRGLPVYKANILRIQEPTEDPEGS